MSVQATAHSASRGGHMLCEEPLCRREQRSISSRQPAKANSASERVKYRGHPRERLVPLMHGMAEREEESDHGQCWARQWL
eukprot:3931694-Rhodomonas_salina.2